MMILVHVGSLATISKSKHIVFRIFPIPEKYPFFLFGVHISLPFLLQKNGILCYVVLHLTRSKIILRFIHIGTCISSPYLFYCWIVFHCVYLTHLLISSLLSGGRNQKVPCSYYFIHYHHPHLLPPLLGSSVL